jgi:hypothetical protein
LATVQQSTSPIVRTQKGSGDATATLRQYSPRRSRLTSEQSLPVTKE